MRPTFAVVAAIAAVIASPAAAESFLESLAKQAAQRAAAKAVDHAINGATDTDAKPKTDGSGQAPAERRERKPKAAGPQPQVWADPSPINYPSAGVDRPSFFEFAPELKARKEAFVEFGRAPCGDCEGGYSYDGWVRHAKGFGGEGVLEEKVTALKLGQRLTWRGAAADGALEIIGEEPIGPFPCKQVRYTLTRKKDKATAERLGLFCKSRAPSDDPDARWLEVA